MNNENALENEIFIIGAWTDNKIKEQNLKNVIKDIKAKNYPVCLVTHYPVSKEIQELVDYFIFEKENILSENWKLTFWRERNGIREERPSLVNYHGVACLMNIRNAVDLLLAKEKYTYMHYIEADLEYDFDVYINLWKNIPDEHQALFVHFQDGQYRTDLFSCYIDWYDMVIPRVQTWNEYTSKALTNNLILEYWFTEIINKTTKEDHITFIKDFQVGNKWTQATEVDWEDDPRAAFDLGDAPEIMFASERRECFEKALESLYKLKKPNPQIVEVGVTRNLGNRSDGDSTSVWAWFVSKYGGSYHGCDISQDSLSVAKQALLQYIGNSDSDKSVDVALTRKDGIEFLHNYNKPIDLLYLDSIDWEKGSHESGVFHLKLLLEGMSKVNVGGFVMFDDTFNVETFDGKADIAIPYLLGGNNFTCIWRGYQFIFRRDI